MTLAEPSVPSSLLNEVKEEPAPQEPEEPASLKSEEVKVEPSSLQFEEVKEELSSLPVEDDIPASQPRSFVQSEVAVVDDDDNAEIPPSQPRRWELLSPTPPKLGSGDPWQDLLWSGATPADRNFPLAPPSRSSTMESLPTEADASVESPPLPEETAVASVTDATGTQRTQSWPSSSKRCLASNFAEALG